MDSLPVEAGAFDLVWSEGALYIMGFEAGLQACRKWLRPGGVVAVSECTWLSTDPPEEAIRYWRVEYPGMRTHHANEVGLDRLGFQDVQSFVLPESAWWENYLGPLSERIEMLRSRYAEDARAQATLEAVSAEVLFHRRHLGT